MRAVWLTLLAVSLALTAIVVGAARGRIAWNTRGVRANWLDWLSGVERPLAGVAQLLLEAVADRPHDGGSLPRRTS